MRNFFIFCSLMLFINSCRNDDISSPEKKELRSEKKLLEEIISPDFLTRIENKLIISSSQSDYMLYVYSLPDLKYLYRNAKKGRGPEEIPLFPMFCESLNKTLYVWGYGPRTIKKFDINQNGEFKLNDTIKLPMYEEFNYMHIFNDSLFIYFLSLCNQRLGEISARRKGPGGCRRGIMSVLIRKGQPRLSTPERLKEGASGPDRSNTPLLLDLQTSL